MITLEKLTNELQINNIDEVCGGWTTTGGSSGGSDRYHWSIKYKGLSIISFSINHTWT